ncbi:MAG TPA: RidA family protein [Anaerolineaceae bacterium]|nr:RidA family protein [Anaerolineaceae bacterium]HPN52441.1 RidA family protein [Anaerolineaceae bacterium]
MKRTILHPEWGLSTCVEVDNLVFLGHHGGHTTREGRQLLTIEEQTEETFKNLKITLDTIGLTFDDIITLNVLLKDIKDFNGMHSVWAKWFPVEFPARTAMTSDFVDDICRIQVYGVAYRRP